MNALIIIQCKIYRTTCIQCNAAVIEEIDFIDGVENIIIVVEFSIPYCKF